MTAIDRLDQIEARANARVIDTAQHFGTDVPALVDALRAGERVMAEREDEMGDAIMPDVRALIRDIRAAITEALA